MALIKKIIPKLFLALVGLVILFIVFFHFYSRSDRPSDREYQAELRDGVRFFEKGRLEYRLGIPFLFVEGDPYEMGLQYGVLLREELTRFFEDVNKFEEEMIEYLLERMAWYGRMAFKVAAPVVLEFKLRSFKSRIPEDYLSRLKGIAEGSKIPLKRFLNLIFYEDLSCSSFIIKSEDRIIHGRNGDQSVSFLGKYPLVSHYNKRGAYRYIDIGVLGIPYAVSGVNEEGLTLSWNGAHAEPIKGNGTMLMFNRILEECKTLDDVDRVSKDVDRFVTVIGSQSEVAGAVFDIVGDDVTRTDMKNRFVFAANRCLSEKMSVKFNSIEDWGWTNRGRLDKYQEILSQAEEFTVDDAIALISNTDFYHYQEDIPPLGSGETINNNLTLSSVVFDPQNFSVYFTCFTHFAGWARWIRYNYRTDEVSVYKEEDKRLQSVEIKEFLKLKKKWRTLNWNKIDNYDALISELELSPLSNAWVLDELWALCYRNQDFEKAHFYADRLIDKYPDLVWGYSDKAYIFKKQERIEEAVQYYLKALDVSLTNEQSRAYFYEQLALLYTSIEDSERSRDCATKSLDLYSKYGFPREMRKRIKKLQSLL